MVEDKSVLAEIMDIGHELLKIAGEMADEVSGERPRGPLRRSITVSVDRPAVGDREILSAWMEVGRRLLGPAKRSEYVTGTSRFENFEDGEMLTGIPMESVLLAYAAKHVSPLLRRMSGSQRARDAILSSWTDIASVGAGELTADLAWEKALDAAAYMIILTAMVMVRSPRDTSKLSAAAEEWAGRESRCSDCHLAVSE